MNGIKENIVTIILVVLIMIILSVVGIFCWKILQPAEEQTSNKIIADDYQYVPIENNKKNTINNSGIKNNETINHTINMSKYYINSNLGKTAEIYNKMLDTLGKQSYISYSQQSIYRGGTYNTNCELDLKNYICKKDGEDSDGKSITYTCWRDTMETRYSYYEPRGTWEKSTFNWFNESDIIYAFMSEPMLIDKDNEYNFSYEENVTRNNSSCYKINAEYVGEDNEKKEKMIMYIEMNTMKLKEVEVTSQNIISSNYIIHGQNNYQFDYTNKVLEIPEDILKI